MKINISEIEKVIATGNLAEISRETGIPRRTLEDWRYENNKWFSTVKERLGSLQGYINKNRK